MQVNKSIKNFLNYFLGPLLFAWLAFTIYQQIVHQPQLGASWQAIKASFKSYKIVYLVIALLLLFVNWGLEAWKWKISVATVHPVSFFCAYEAVLSGVSFSVTMPNRVGEYLGRMIYLPEGSRLRTISVTLVGSFAQLLVTLIVGVAGLVVLRPALLSAYPQLLIWYQFVLYGLAAMVFLFTLVYFNVSGSIALFHRWFRTNKYLYLVEALGQFTNKLLLQVLALSFARYLVFIVQYVLVYYLFEVNVSAIIIAWVMSIVFLALAIVPSITLVDIGVRGQVSLQLMGIYSGNSLGISLATLVIWGINLIIPAILGSLLLLNFRIFRQPKQKEIKRQDKVEE